MNKKVIKIVLALIVTFLSAIYILKIFYPSQFVMAIHNKAFITAGEFIDSSKVATIIFGTIIGCVFDYFYFSAVCRKFKLNWILFLIIGVYNVGYSLFVYLAPETLVMEQSNLLMSLSIIYMILTPMFFTKELLPLSLTYSINAFAQCITLSIRNIGMLMLNTSSVVVLFMSLECYLWMIFLSLLFNLKERRGKDGTL